MIKYLTAKDLMKQLDCGKNTIYNLLQYSNIPKIRIGRRYYIPEDEFDRWMKNNIGAYIKVL